MLSDFTKINTFLMIYKEKSFLKAAAKLGISQPAVTQQIRILEKFIDAKLIDRKKNGIKLTKEGEQFLNIALKLQRCLNNAEEQFVKLMDKDIVYKIGASRVIGDYMLPKVLTNIKQKIDNEVSLDVGYSLEIIDKLINKEIDLALVESPIFTDETIHREWMDDEIVIFSNQPLQARVKKDDLLKFKWICREKNSHTRKIFKEYAEQLDFDCSDLDVVTEASSLTTIIQTVLYAPKDEQNPTVSIASLRALKEYVNSKRLFITRLSKLNMKRKLYIVYLKDKKNDAFTDKVISYLMSLNSSKLS